MNPVAGCICGQTAVCVNECLGNGNVMTAAPRRKIDKLKDELRTNHIARLQRGECSLAAGFVLSDLLTNLERVADHCSNIAGCLLDMKNERIDLHKYLGDVKSGSNEFLMQYNTFEEKYKLA